MKPIEKPLPVEVTQTPIAKAIAEHHSAVAILEQQRSEARNLRTRIAELDAAIREAQKNAEIGSSMATMTIDQIKVLSAKKASSFAEVSGLQCARDIATVELKDLEDERANAMLASDTKPAPWALLYADLLQAIDLDAIEKLLAVASQARKGQQTIAFDLGLGVAPNAVVIEELAHSMGLPL